MPEWLIMSCGIAFAALMAGAAFFWVLKQRNRRHDDLLAPPSAA